ncbi:MAG TPA: ATP-binding cassette domain-containing protein [Acidimicrobiales bacterium]|nr:ATP-binding cassette domain-containing protein [Acidimicrobiales bacterium]
MLELSGLTRRFGSVVALDNLSFDVPAGQVFGFLGPNGAGKTTAMRAILGISALDGGEVRWEGRRATEQDRRHFGYMPEERGLYPTMIVSEQLEYLAELRGMARSAARSSVQTWLEKLGVAERAGDKLEALSLGNQQRVQLAAAFVHGPELLVLDEPFSGLDPVGIDSLSAVLHEEANNGATVVFSSHQLDLVEHMCESVAIINRGRLVATGTVDDLTTAGPTRLQVQVAGDGDGKWARALRGVEVVENDDGRLRLLLKGRTKSETVLRAAEKAGTLRHFSIDRRRLSEVFREAVAS